MYSRNIDNLMLAGRCLSSSHAAMGAIRVMNTLGAAAEAVGIAAALCNEHGVDPREVRQFHMEELQQRILKADGYIIGLENRDPADLARTAVVSTSSELRFQAENVDGFVELDYDLAQQLPLSKGRVEKIWILLKSERTEPCPIRVSVLESNKLGRFQREELIVDAEITIAPRGEQWVEVEVNRQYSRGRTSCGSVWKSSRGFSGLFRIRRRWPAVSRSGLQEIFLPNRRMGRPGWLP